jgi:outer membrane protein assembly factor BamB
VSCWPRQPGARRRGPPARAAALGAVALTLALSACGERTKAEPNPARPLTTPSTLPAEPTTAARPTTTAPATGQSAWTTYGGSFARTSVDSVDAAPTHAPLRAWTSPALGGPVYGEPLVYQGQVLVATENDTVYGLSAANGTVAWSMHLATPVPAGMLPCGDITPVVGVTSTMVIDPATGVLYVSAEQLSSGAVAHVLYAIDLSTHEQRWALDVDQPGWDAAAQLQRAALALDDGRVLVGFGGNFGDCGSYHGWVIGIPESGSGPVVHYQVPTANLGAIWAPAGITVGASGDVYVATGNGSAGPGQPFDYGNAVIELSPSLSELQFFAPTSWAEDNAADLDLGATAPVLLGNGQLLIVGKQATAYLLEAAALGGIGGQIASVSVCNSRGGSAYLAPFAYMACPDSGQIVQVRVGPGDTLSPGWTWSSPDSAAGSPTIAEGVLWTMGTGTLYGVDLSTGTTRYRLPLDVGTVEHFSAPGAASGLIVVAGSRAVEAFR